MERKEPSKWVMNVGGNFWFSRPRRQVKRTTSDLQLQTVYLIQEVVAEHFRLSVSEMLGRKRYQYLARPRHIAAYLSREITTLPLEQVGKCFRRHHATILSSLARVRAKRRTLAPVLDELREEVYRRKANKLRGNTNE